MKRKQPLSVAKLMPNLFNDYVSINIELSNFTLSIGETQSGKLTSTMIRSFVGTEESDSVEIEIKCLITANALGVDISNNKTS